jgi:hypothetical protein
MAPDGDATRHRLSLPRRTRDASPVASTDGTPESASERAERASEAARKMQENRQTMQRLAGQIADTELHLAATLRTAAAAATRQGRTEDAERLTREAVQAESYAEVERKRADAD